MREFKSVFGNTVFIASVVGMYYLTVFVIAENMPFPLELSVLPSMLAILGLLGLLVTSVVLIYLSISFISATDVFMCDYPSLIFTHDKQEKFWSNTIVNFLIFFGTVPIVMFLGTSLHFSFVSEISVLFIFTIPALYSYYALTPRTSIVNDKFQSIKSTRFVKAYFNFFFICILSVVSMAITFGLAEKLFNSYSEPLQPVLLFIFLITNYFLVLPTRKAAYSQPNTMANIRMAFKDNIKQLPAFYVIIALLIGSLIPTVAHKTAIVALAKLGIGGKIERRYYFSADDKKHLPASIILKCKLNDYCETKPLIILLDIGSILYIKGTADAPSLEVTSLERNKFHILGKSEFALDQN